MDIFKEKNIIGSDETGVGDYLTPLVVAAAFVPKQNIKKIVELGVKDSKKITDKKILEIFEKIKYLIKSSVRFFSQAKYNYLSENKKYNAHELKTLLHWEAINALEKRVENIDLIVIDQYASEKNINKYKNNLFKNNEKIVEIKNNISFLEKAEDHVVSVAVASIVARAYFLKLLEEQNKKWNMVFPLGTNKKVIDFTKDFIKKHNKSNLYKIAKINFKTTKEVLNNI